MKKGEELTRHGAAWCDAHLREFFERLEHPRHRPVPAAHQDPQVRHLTHVLLQRRGWRRAWRGQVNARQRVQI